MQSVVCVQVYILYNIYESMIIIIIIFNYVTFYWFDICRYGILKYRKISIILFNLAHHNHSIIIINSNNHKNSLLVLACLFSFLMMTFIHILTKSFPLILIASIANSLQIAINLQSENENISLESEINDQGQQHLRSGAINNGTFIGSLCFMIIISKNFFLTGQLLPFCWLFCCTEYI